MNIFFLIDYEYTIVTYLDTKRLTIPNFPQVFSLKIDSTFFHLIKIIARVSTRNSYENERENRSKRKYILRRHALWLDELYHRQLSQQRDFQLAKIYVRIKSTARIRFATKRTVKYSWSERSYSQLQ